MKYLGRRPIVVVTRKSTRELSLSEWWASPRQNSPCVRALKLSGASMHQTKSQRIRWPGHFAPLTSYTTLAAMAKGNSKSKTKGKTKSKLPHTVSYTPVASSLGLAAASRAGPSTLVINTLKAVRGGGYKVSGSTTFSGINTSCVPEAPKSTVLDLLRAWNGVAKGNGWDQGYVDSFLELEELPPTHDPDLPGHSKEPGVHKPLPLTLANSDT